MKISRDDVLRVAELAHLELSEAEVETYRGQLDSILTYIDKLNEVELSGVEPMAQVLFGSEAAVASGGGSRSVSTTLSKSESSGEANAALREDTVEPCGLAQAVLEDAPDAAKPYFRVPKVIER